MTGELVAVVEDAAAAVELAELEQRARSFARDSRAASTWRSYDSDFAHFRSWCAEHRPALDPLPATPATVALYLSALAQTHKSSTIRRRLASISVAHQVAGFDTPTADAGVRAVWAGIRRRQGTAPRKMRAARTKLVTAMVASLGDGLAEARDRTLLLFGFAGRCAAANWSPSTSKTSAKTTPTYALSCLSLDPQMNRAGERRVNEESAS